MKLRVGILGLPNVGKSTLFNALARQSLAEAANFPFCTIGPNSCRVPIWDPWLEELETFGSTTEKVVPASMEWVDVAGLVKNAHNGEGLGNQFLGNLRSCACLCHVVRGFEDPQVAHVDGCVDPLKDMETIQLELLLADLSHVQRRLERTNLSDLERETLECIQHGLQEGIPARSLSLSEGALFSIRSMGLLTLKPVLYAWNVDEADFLLDRDKVEQQAHQTLENLENFHITKDAWAVVSASVESQLAQSSDDEQTEYLESLGCSATDMESLRFCYQVLPNLVVDMMGYATVYTGPGVPPERSKTTKAHLFATNSQKEDDQTQQSSDLGLTSDALAGRIHADIQKGFLRAEVLGVEELLKYSDWNAAKEAGKVRAEGRDYLVQNRDVVLIKWKQG